MYWLFNQLLKLLAGVCLLISYQNIEISNQQELQPQEEQGLSFFGSPISL